jgi:hypothetical protein
MCSNVYVKMQSLTDFKILKIKFGLVLIFKIISTSRDYCNTYTLILACSQVQTTDTFASLSHKVA